MNGEPALAAGALTGEGQSYALPLQGLGSPEGEMEVAAMVNSLIDQGYCSVQMPGSDEMCQAAKEEAETYSLLSGFTCLHAELAEHYLGCDSSGKVAWLDGRLEDSAVGYYRHRVSAVAGLVAPALAVSLGTDPDAQLEGQLLRQPCPARERSSLDPGPIGQAQVQEGVVEKFLDFVRRRRLCLMHFIACDSGETVQLSPRKQHTDGAAVKLTVVPGMLLIFRHDLLNYTYVSTGDHLVLQGWLMEPRPSLAAEITGSEERIFDLIGGHGSSMCRSDEVHATSIACTIGGNGKGFEGVTTLYQLCTDIFVKIPLARWDHDLYFSDDLQPGKALVKHSGMVNDDDIFKFDNKFFGMSDMEATTLTPCAYMNLQCSFEVLHGAGFTTLEMLHGKQIDFVNAGAARETELEERYNPYREQFRRNSLEVERSFAMAGWSHAVEYMFPAVIFGLTGRTRTIDTACSASNVAVQICYQDLRVSRDSVKYQRLSSIEPSTMAVAESAIYSNTVLAFVGLSQAHMLGKTGRSKTYDMSADGYARSEGCGAMFMCLSEELDHACAKLVDIIGGCINQDGRSASLTAPNGPSQTAVVRTALRDSGREATDLNISEMHGTGTALGDPIETGSLKVALNRGRIIPLIHQAGKSMTGHIENGAGITGIIKNIAAVVYGSTFSNCHLKELNSNIDEGGYPALFPSELYCYNWNLTHAGISSFGFGGTNCRTNIWGANTRGAGKLPPVAALPSGLVIAQPALQVGKDHKLEGADVLLTTCPRCFGSMRWLDGEAYDRIDFGTKHRCNAIRDEVDTYEYCSHCYKGGYLLGGPAGTFDVNPLRKVYIIGSWSNWSEYEEMTETIEGTYEYVMTLSDMLSDQFNIVLDADPQLTLYPVVPKAPARVRIAGPDGHAKSRRWLIDGALFSMPAGTSYKITFSWNDTGKHISWEPVAQDVQAKAGRNRPQDVFSVVCSWASWKPIDMTPSEEDDDTWEARFKLNLYGKAEFHFVRNHDSSQRVYPAGVQVMDESVPILGPDAAGEGNNWLVRGIRGEPVTVRLCVRNRDFTLVVRLGTAICSKERTWRSLAPPRSRFYLVGSHNGWGSTQIGEHEMREHPHQPGVYRGEIFAAPPEQGEVSSQAFQILINEDWHRVFHPHRPCVFQGMTGESLAYESNSESSHGLYWSFLGAAGSIIEITLDLRSSQKGPVVSCSPAELTGAL